MLDNPKDRSLQLDVQLCFALHASARAISKVYMETLRSEHVTYPQYLVLLVLLEEDGLSVSEIGDRLHLDSGTLTPLIKRMEKLEFVTRQRSTEDERSVHVYLTDQGRSLRHIALKAREVVVDRLDMSEADIIEMRKQLMEITKRLGGD